MAMRLGVLLGAVAWVAIGQGALAQTSAERGQALVTGSCGGCHAVGAEGRSARPGAPPFRNLNRRFSMGMLEEELRSGMLTGHPPMPPFQFSQVQIGDIMAYLRSVQNSRRIARGDGLPANSPIMGAGAPAALVSLHPDQRRAMVAANSPVGARGIGFP